jgi:CarD family transcriptional regulator
MFALNEKVVYPGHGVARISRIIDKKVGNVTISFYELKFLNKEMTILVPTHNFLSVGLRQLSSNKIIDDMLDLLSQPIGREYQELTASNWNKRSKEYQCKIRTGSIKQIGEIYRDLKYISHHKELSFGEKNLLLQTEALLAEEISLVIDVDKDRVVERLRTLFSNAKITVSVPVTLNNKPIVHTTL